MEVWTVSLSFESASHTRGEATVEKPLWQARVMSLWNNVIHPATPRNVSPGAERAEPQGLCPAAPAGTGSAGEKQPGAGSSHAHRDLTSGLCSRPELPQRAGRSGSRRGGGGRQGRPGPRGPHGRVWSGRGGSTEPPTAAPDMQRPSGRTAWHCSWTGRCTIRLACCTGKEPNCVTIKKSFWTLHLDFL